MQLYDAQSTMAFVLSQNTHIEAGVYATRYPDIQYQGLIPVDTSAHPFAKTVTYFSSDKFGAAKWINGNSDDVPIAGTNRAKHETAVHTAGIGYAWGWEEVGQAQRLGINLQADDAMAARRAYEEMVDTVALVGDTEKGFSGGLFNHTGVTAVAAEYGNWDAANPDNIIADVNNGLTNVTSDTNTTFIADTLVMPWRKMQLLGSTRLTDTNDTILSFIMKNNVYTLTTGQQLLIRGARLLDGVNTETSPPSDRMIAYRRSPEVLKLHIPMPLRFLGVHQDGPLRWVVPGVFRLGGLDIRQPKAVSYIDGI
jgi:hypothetical protein